MEGASGECTPPDFVRLSAGPHRPIGPQTHRPTGSARLKLWFVWANRGRGRGREAPGRVLPTRAQDKYLRDKVRNIYPSSAANCPLPPTTATYASSFQPPQAALPAPRLSTTACSPQPPTEARKSSTPSRSVFLPRRQPSDCPKIKCCGMCASSDDIYSKTLIRSHRYASP
jgi:hypothetical protein